MTDNRSRANSRQTMTRRRRSPLATLQGRLAERQAIHALLAREAESVPLRRDMVTLLTFVRDTKVVGTASTGNMPLKAIATLAPLLTTPPVLETSIGDQVYPARSEDQVWPIHLLHILGEVGGLLEAGRSRRWKLTPHRSHLGVANGRSRPGMAASGDRTHGHRRSRPVRGRAVRPHDSAGIRPQETHLVSAHSVGQGAPARHCAHRRARFRRNAGNVHAMRVTGSLCR